MADETPLDARNIRLELTLPCDERFRPVLRVICHRIIRYVGYPEPQAAEIASAVVHATDGVLEHQESPEYTSLAVTVATSTRDIEFRIRYLCGVSDTGPGVESLLSQRRGSEVPLDAMRRVMRGVEFGSSDGVEYCVLNQLLPPPYMETSHPDES